MSFTIFQIENLRQQLEIMQKEKIFSRQELELTIKESNYDAYLQYLKETKKKPITSVPFSEERNASFRKTATAQSMVIYYNYEQTNLASLVANSTHSIVSSCCYLFN